MNEASIQQDRFVHDRLPPVGDWPEIVPMPGVPMTGPLNCVNFLLDRHLMNGGAHRPAFHSASGTWSYGELNARVARLARMMVEDHGIRPGNRVLIRGFNSPAVAASWLAIQKIGAVAVTTMPLLRAGELTTILNISQPALALCDEAIAAELEVAITSAATGTILVTWIGECGEPASACTKPDSLNTAATQAQDISLIAFTSGTTGRPKATVHFHRDVLAICQTMNHHIVSPSASDVFIGTAPLAFTFGLGGLLVFPLHVGASSVLYPSWKPDALLEGISRHQASVCFTVPTFFQRMLRLDDAPMLSQLRLAISSGEALPLPVRHAWQETAGSVLAEVIGSTEMLHAFAGATGGRVRSGFIGPAIPGYEILVLDEDGQALPSGELGRLAVKGPTGCRYLADERQHNYVKNGWNLTGDTCAMDEDGYIAYHTRRDDMIISSGYNISGLEVENALLQHPAVAECAVIGEPDADRGQVVAAYVVARDGLVIPELEAMLQDYVRQVLAPYKYPRIIRFIDSLPRNESGKVQRFRLRKDATT
ncbi:MAG: AMP-binding protein [Anderseniella sp.]